MHVIRLRAPWTATANDRGIVYSRTFHRPTGAEQQSIQLRIETRVDADAISLRLNSTELPVARSGEGELYFDLRELRPFNQLEIQLTCSQQVDPAPAFGTFLIQSVELQIV